MRFLSLFSGIEAASVAWLPLGWECVAVAEIDKFPCEVLKHYYPDVPNLGDITKITQEQIEALGHIDLVVGGFPCQDLSVAGKRKGFTNDDGSATRSGLFYTAMQITRWTKARWLLLENVPGIYSSNSGLDFTAMVGEILNTKFPNTRKKWQNSGMACSRTGLLEWRTFDAQYFGVPQRRRRMFALADFGNWTDRPPVLFERDSLSGNPAPSRKTRQEVTEIAGTLTSNGGGLNRPAGNANELDFCIVSETAKTLTRGTGQRYDFETDDFITYALAGNTIGRQPENGGNGDGWGEDVSYTLTKTDQHAVAIPINTMTMMGRPSDDKNPRMGSGIGKDGEPCPTLTKVHSHAVAHTFKVRGGCEGGGKGYLGQDEKAFTLSTGQDQHLMTPTMQIRRLTPLECERLQGFPDNYTNIEGASDTARYKALGNSMAVPVMRWIGEQIQKNGQ